MAEEVNLNIPIARRVRERLRVAAKHFKKTSAGVARDAIEERIDYLESKIRTEKQQAKLDAEAKQAPKQRTGRISKSNGTLLAPAFNAMEPEALDPKPAVSNDFEPYDPLESVITHHAARISEVLGKSSIEERLRVQEAVSAVKKAAPLTHPDDRKILALLEAEIIRLREKAPLTKAPAEEPRVINPREVSTTGDV